MKIRIEKNPQNLIKLLKQISCLADSEKSALGFLPEKVFQVAISKHQLFALIRGTASNPKLVGYLLWGGIWPHAKIQQIAVAAKYRKQHEASRLMQDFVSEMDQRGYTDITAKVASDLNIAQAFYKNHKFEIVQKLRGGRTTKRHILEYFRVLPKPGLLPAPGRVIQLLNADREPIYAIDLNIFFDVARDRDQSANKLISACFNHLIRLVLADEFLNELKRNRKPNDPALKFALELPKLPDVDTEKLENLAKKIYKLIFARQDQSPADSEQAISDTRHIAHATLARATAFITRDGKILDAQRDLLENFGIDIATPEQIIEWFFQETQTARSEETAGSGFNVKDVCSEQLRTYLDSQHVEKAQLIEQFCAPGEFTQRQAVFEDGNIVAVGALQTPQAVAGPAKLLIHGLPSNPHYVRNIDHLLTKFVRIACKKCPAMVELAYIQGQAEPRNLATAHGFTLLPEQRYIKVAAGQPLTNSNWQRVIDSMRRHTGLVLPNSMLKHWTKKITIKDAADKKVLFTPPELEEFLSPTLIVCAGRDAVVVPIQKDYADELLETSDQLNFDFLKKKTAVLFARRRFVNSSRFAKVIQPGNLILFYESQSSSGRGAIVAAARIVDTVVQQKGDISLKQLEQAVVNNVENFSASNQVLLTTFDNLFRFSRPVDLKKLRHLKADKANLVGPFQIDSGKTAEIFSLGWEDE